MTIDKVACGVIGYINKGDCIEISDNENIKPPLGLRPKRFSDDYRHRFMEVQDAINRYFNHEEYIKIPNEWIEEYNYLVDILK